MQHKHTLSNNLLIIAAALLLISISSCSCESKLARLQRKYPDLFKTDTLTLRDTIREDRRDTVFSRTTHDTVILQKGRLEVRYYHTRDSVYLSGKCRDSVIVRQVVVQPKPVVITKNATTWEKLQWGFGIGFLLLLLVLLFRHR